MKTIIVILLSSICVADAQQAGAYSGFPDPAVAHARKNKQLASKTTGHLKQELSGRINSIFGDIIILNQTRYYIYGPENDKTIAITNAPGLKNLAIDQHFQCEASRSGNYNGGDGLIMELWDCQPDKSNQPKPPTVQEIEAAKQKQIEEIKRQEEKIQAARAKALQWHQQLADKGDAFGQYEMGRRHLTGDGVEKDEAKAKEYFHKAAAQGNKSATEALQKLEGK